MENVALNERKHRRDDFGLAGKRTTQNHVGHGLYNNFIFNGGQQNHPNSQDPKNTTLQLFFELIKLFQKQISEVVETWFIKIPKIIIRIILGTIGIILASLIWGICTGDWEFFNQVLKILEAIFK